MCNLHSTPHFSAFRLKVSHLWRRFFWMSSFGLYLVKKTVQYIFIEVSLTDMLSSFASLWFPMFFTVLFSFLRRIYYPPRSVIIFTIIIDFFFLTSPKKKLIFLIIYSYSHCTIWKCSSKQLFGGTRLLDKIEEKEQPKQIYQKLISF